MSQEPPFETNDTAKEARIAESRELLKLLNFDSERCNERSALVLLALLQLGAQQPWREARHPMLRTVEIMYWLRDTYDKDYKPNTRETVRRQTLHQFVDAGLVVQNPDEPLRPVNSPKWCYQVEPAAHALITTFQDDGFHERLKAYLVERPGLIAAYARERDMNRIPVQLPNGEQIELSPGGQNPLIVKIIEEFCQRYTPGGEVLYIGDADTKWQVFEETALAKLGVRVDSHGKMPDVVVYVRDKNWLVLIEAASSHGPVDYKRYRELTELFSGSSAGLVFISCLPSKAELQKYFKNIAWETDVWCADNPTHLIHFNGERFLGPYS